MGTSNTRDYYKLGGPLSTPTVITTSGWLGAQTNNPAYTIDANGMIQAQESLWGSAKSIPDGVQAIDLSDCNMITCTLTENTILTATGGHSGQVVTFIFTEDVTGDWTVTFSTGFDATSVKSGVANELIGVIFAYDGTLWKEVGSDDTLPSGLINQSLRHDGDGSIFISKKGQCGINIVGNYNDLQVAATIFNSIGCTMKVPRKDGSIYQVVWGSRYDVTKIMHYLYDNATIYLHRKKFKADQILDIYNNKDI